MIKTLLLSRYNPTISQRNIRNCPLLTRSRRHRCVCRYNWMWNKTQYPQNSGNTIHCRISIVYCPDCVADRELQLAAPAQHHDSIAPRIVSQGNDQNPSFEVWFLLNAYCFQTIVKLKNHVMSGTVCIWKECKINHDYVLFWLISYTFYLN